MADNGPRAEMYKEDPGASYTESKEAIKDS